MADPDPLDPLRLQIDQIDKQIIELLNSRAADCCSDWEAQANAGDADLCAGPGEGDSRPGEESEPRAAVGSLP